MFLSAAEVGRFLTAKEPDNLSQVLVYLQNFLVDFFLPLASRNSS